jgi:hypothetical protein
MIFKLKRLFTLHRLPPDPAIGYTEQYLLEKPGTPCHKTLAIEIRCDKSPFPGTP